MGLYGPGREVGLDEFLHGDLEHAELLLARWEMVELLPLGPLECQSKHGLLIRPHHSSDPSLRYPYVESSTRCWSTEDDVVVSPTNGSAHQVSSTDSIECHTSAERGGLHDKRTSCGGQ